MAYTIPVKIYEKLEEKLGKETALVVVEALEESIRKAFEETQERQKATIIEELKKELASKYDIELVKKEIDAVRKEIEYLQREIKKDLKIITIILLAVIILLNQNSIEFIAKLLGLLK
ncbi:MAG: hypothetical protein ABWJ99_07680 [Caldimicrobium sp.]